MPDQWDGRYVLRPPRDHGDDQHYMVYAAADTADKLRGINAVGTAPRLVSKASYSARLIPDTGRDVVLADRPGAVRMHVYQLLRRAP